MENLNNKRRKIIQHYNTTENGKKNMGRLRGKNKIGKKMYK